MNSDKIVTKEDILNAIMRLRQRGNQPVMEDLEHREPDLTEHLLEELTLIHTKLGSLGVSLKSQRQLHRRIEALMLVLILAMESAHARLWADVAGIGDEESSDESPSTANKGRTRSGQDPAAPNGGINA